jgi:hypothetical protein
MEGPLLAFYESFSYVVRVPKAIPSWLWEGNQIARHPTMRIQVCGAFAPLRAGGFRCVSFVYVFFARTRTRTCTRAQSSASAEAAWDHEEEHKARREGGDPSRRSQVRVRVPPVRV